MGWGHFDGTVAPKAREPSPALAEQPTAWGEHLCSPWTGESCGWSTVTPTNVRGRTEGLRAVAAIPSGQETHLSTTVSTGVEALWN